MKKLLLLAIFIFLLNLSSVTQATQAQVEKTAYAAYLQGLMAERYGDEKEALAYYGEAKDLDVSSKTIRLKLAVEHIQQGNYDSAVDLLSQLSADDNVNVDAYLLLILMHSTQGNDSKASNVYIELLERLYDLDPSNLKIAESLAQHRIQLGELDRASLIYEKIVELHPDYEEGLYWLGFLYEELNKRDDAVLVWSKLLTVNPLHGNGLNSLAYVYAEENKYLEKAEEMVKLALEQHPDSVAYRDTLGWIYFKQNKLVEARDMIEELTKGFVDPVILDHLGDIYERLGESQKAIEQWQRALMLVPANEDLKQKMRKLQEGQHDK